MKVNHASTDHSFGTDNLFTVQLLPNHLMKHDTSWYFLLS